LPGRYASPGRAALAVAGVPHHPAPSSAVGGA